MAVQQNKKSPSRRGHRRSHDHLTAVCLACEPTTGERHLRHHIAPSGTYRGRKVLMTKLEKRRTGDSISRKGGNGSNTKTTSLLTQAR